MKIKIIFFCRRELAVTRNHVCLHLKYYGNFHVFCASRTIWPLVDSYCEYL